MRKRAATSLSQRLAWSWPGQARKPSAITGVTLLTR